MIDVVLFWQPLPLRRSYLPLFLAALSRCGFIVIFLDVAFLVDVLDGLVFSFVSHGDKFSCFLVERFLSKSRFDLLFGMMRL